MSNIIAKNDLFPSSLTAVVIVRTTLTSPSSEYNGPTDDCIEATEMFMILFQTLTISS